MWGSATVYSGLILAAAGLALFIKPIPRFRVRTRRRALAIAAAGVGLAGIGLVLPVSESRTSKAVTQLDEFAPVWQFREVHTRRVAAPPPRVFEAIRQVRADEIFLFRTLTWIRRGGRPLPPGILNAGTHESLIDVATHNGFVQLALDVPRELVVGTVVLAPPGTRGTLTPRIFQTPLPPGFALATMNFVVTADGPNGSLVRTETRVFANSASARRRFAAYWRVIYPGSALIRHMWLRAIQRRAEDAVPRVTTGDGSHTTRGKPPCRKSLSTALRTVRSKLRAPAAAAFGNGSSARRPSSERSSTALGRASLRAIKRLCSPLLCTSKNRAASCCARVATTRFT